MDLRKHLSTRDVLQYTGARFLAGYDYMGQFPFLDIALEWEGDKTLQRKRSHIVDDLLALVEAIATACGTDRNLLPAVAERPDPATLPEAVRALFDKPVVAMHIGAGNITKTWPAEYFSALIDLLTERNDVNVHADRRPGRARGVRSVARQRCCGPMRSVRSRVRRRWTTCRDCCRRAACISATTAGRSTSPRRWAYRRSAFIPVWWMRSNGGRSAGVPWRSGAT